MRRSMVLSLLLFVLVPAAAADGADMLYFADNSDHIIYRCNLDGSSPEALFASDIEHVGTIAIDGESGRIYWTDWTAGTIKAANLDGTGTEVILSGLSGPYGLALDAAAGKLYWTEFSTPRIRRSNLDGSGMEDLVTTGIVRPAGIALDIGGGMMYWADGATATSAKIERAALDGTALDTLIEDPLLAPQAVRLDTQAGMIYFTDIGLDSLYRAGMDGSGLESILPSELGTMPGLVVDPAAGYLYFSDYGGSESRISRAGLDGSGLVDLISSGFGSIYGLEKGPYAECSDMTMEGVWLVLITGVEVYDYAVYLIFDGHGTIDDMGAYNVPYPAGSYDVSLDCGLSGDIWSDGYVPFTGEILSDTLAQVDIGSGPFDLIRVADTGLLEGCWEGDFIDDTTSVTLEAALQVDSAGSVAGTIGAGYFVAGKMFSDSGYLAGLMTDGQAMTQFMLLDAHAQGDSVLSGTWGRECVTGSCGGGTFYLARCGATDAGEGVPAHPRTAVAAYPNPFNPRTIIDYTVEKAGPVSLGIYDVSGRLVASLVDGYETAGTHRTEWSGRNSRGLEAGSGVYLLRLESGREIRTKKIVLLR